MRSLQKMAVACTALALMAFTGSSSAWASSPPSDGPGLAFTAMTALKLRGFSVGTIRADGVRTVLARGSRHGVVPNYFSRVSWSADGVWLAFAGSKGRRAGIYKVRADGTGLRFLHGTKGGSNPLFSPDGSKIAFTRNRFGVDLSVATTTWVAEADGGGAFRLAPWRPNVEYLPSSFSPDGSVLAVTRSNWIIGKSIALLFELDGSRGIRLLARRASEASFSPDGSQIALVRHKVLRQGKILIVVNKDLYVMSADGTASKAMTRTHRIAETRPSWDPSGQRIAFNSFRIGEEDSLEAIFDEFFPFGNSIVQINADGSCRQKIVSLKNTAFFWPTWQPGANHEAGRIEC